MASPLVLLGESPPPGAPPNFRPFDCQSGDRLARHLLGLRSRAPLLDHVPIVNVFDEPGTGIAGKGPAWNHEAARANGRGVLFYARRGTVVALGEKPRAALGLQEMPVGHIASVTVGDPVKYPVWVLALPHPSGRSSALQAEPKRAAMRRALLPEIVASCPGLRPWHFRLDEPAILLDLAVAVSPLRPHAAAAGLVVANERRNLGADRVTLRALAEACGALPGEASPLDYMRGVGLLLGLGNDAEKHRSLRDRAKFCARTMAFDDVDPAVLRATALRLSALGVTP